MKIETVGQGGWKQTRSMGLGIEILPIWAPKNGLKNCSEGEGYVYPPRQIAVHIILHVFRPNHIFSRPKIAVPLGRGFWTLICATPAGWDSGWGFLRFLVCPFYCLSYTYTVILLNIMSS